MSEPTRKYTFSMHAAVSREDKAGPPMAECALTYRELEYNEMVLMEDKYIVTPLNEFHALAKTKAMLGDDED